MDWVEALQDVNYWAVIGAVVSSFAVGMAWYSPSVFGKTWMKELGFTKKEMEDKSGMPRAMVHSAISAFISASVMAALMMVTGTDTLADGAIFGAVIGFGIAMSAMVTHDVFSKKSMTLTQINGLHDVVKFAVMGAILGNWM